MKSFSLLIISIICCTTAIAQNSIPWGVSAHPLRQAEWDNVDLSFSLINQAGIGWLREDFQFGKIYQVDGRFDFSSYDKLVNKAEEYNINILPILQAYDNEVLKQTPDLVPIYKHPEEWRRYVRETVKRYHSKLKYWEIWNEPDGGFWKPVANAEQYVLLLKIAYEEIKKIDPTCQVIIGGLCYWNADYVEAMYKAGAKGYFDVIAVHPYNHAVDANIKAERERTEFYNVIAKYESKDIPVWITEFGGTSHKSELVEQAPYFMPKAIQYSLDKLNKSVSISDITIGLAISPRIKNIEEINFIRKWLPGVTLKPILYDELQHVDPLEVPVIIGAEGLKIDEPLLAPLYAYAQRGGLLIGHEKVPFHTIFTQDQNGNWLYKDVGEKLYPMWGMQYDGFWTKKGIPNYTAKVKTSDDALAANMPNVSNIYVDRFLSAANLKKDGHYYPIIQAMHNDEVVGEGMSLYTFNNHNGGILLSTIRLDAGFTEEEQANLLQRNYLTYLSLGVERLFWYDLHNDGKLKGEKEDNFGLLTYEWQPKPAYHAYTEMVAHLGESPKFIKRIEGNDTNVWALLFERSEDNKKVLAIWSTDETCKFIIKGKAGDKLVRLRSSKVKFISINNNESIMF